MNPLSIPSNPVKDSLVSPFSPQTAVTSLSSLKLGNHDRGQYPAQNPPQLLHTLHHETSVLALAISSRYKRIFSGTQDGRIVVWSLGTYHREICIQAHRRSVLALHLSPDESLLFSAAGDQFINVWCTRTLVRLYEIYSVHDVGDIFSLAYSPQHNTLYFGAQNATIQWITLSDPKACVTPQAKSHPDRRSHRFFDSKAIGGAATPRRQEDHWKLIPPARTVLEVDPAAIRTFAHYGYIYAMLVATGPTVLVERDEDVLISGSGDGTITMWRIGKGSPDGKGTTSLVDGKAIMPLFTLGEDDAESVFSLAIDGSFLYAGKLGGIVELWDLDTKQRLRSIQAHNGDVMALRLSWGSLWASMQTGFSARHSTAHYGASHGQTSDLIKTTTVASSAPKYQCLSRWKSHDGKVLASDVATYGNKQLFVSGGNDQQVCIWLIGSEEPLVHEAESKEVTEHKGVPQQDPSSSHAMSMSSSSSMATPESHVEDDMFKALRNFVSYKTVSAVPDFAEDCYMGATYLGVLFKEMGGNVSILHNVHEGGKPTVLARFEGKLEPKEQRKRILFYGHYDVVAAHDQQERWKTDPFTMQGADGYFYGRGVSDNKGPIMAALFAVTDLMQKRELENDVVFLIEGEEENGSHGFCELVRKNKHLIGSVDYILLANSYWLDDQVPCLTYGLRGVLHATVTVSSKRPDLHSGVDGSFLNDEPLSDLTLLLSNLKGRGNRIQIPGFYDGILPLTDEESAYIDDVVEVLTRRPRADSPATLKASLLARWREPNLTIHNYKVSGPGGSLVSSRASANISLRLVPQQESKVVSEALVTYLREQFGQLSSNNHLTVTIDNSSEPWLGDPNNALFRTLEKAIVKAWPDIFAPSASTSIVSTPSPSHPSSKSPSPSSSPSLNQALQAQEAPPVSDVLQTSPMQNGKPSPLTIPPTIPDIPPTSARSPVSPRSHSFSRTQKPLYIREGGSIPAIRFLEKEFEAPAANFPCGQSSDSAHMPNERLRVLNIIKAREILVDVFQQLGH